MIAGWTITKRNTAPREQTSITLAWPAGRNPSAKLVRAIVRATGWRGDLPFVSVIKHTWRPGRLLLDYDRRDPPTVGALRELLGLMNLRARSIEYSHSKSGGWHLVIELRERLDLAHTIAAQAILGSDPNREAFNLARARTVPGRFWRARANVLFGERL